jgi:hypothetical protein
VGCAAQLASSSQKYHHVDMKNTIAGNIHAKRYRISCA